MTLSKKYAKHSVSKLTRGSVLKLIVPCSILFSIVSHAAIVSAQIPSSFSNQGSSLPITNQPSGGTGSVLQVTPQPKPVVEPVVTTPVIPATRSSPSVIPQTTPSAPGSNQVIPSTTQIVEKNFPTFPQKPNNTKDKWDFDNPTSTFFKTNTNINGISTSTSSYTSNGSNFGNGDCDLSIYGRIVGGKDNTVSSQPIDINVRESGYKAEAGFKFSTQKCLQPEDIVNMELSRHNAVNLNQCIRIMAALEAKKGFIPETWLKICGALNPNYKD